MTRGIELLAEGERRNKGNDHPNPELRSPANPEMRYHIGFTYQLKIGQSDDQNVMQCLLDMSMMDPADRYPESLWAAGAQGKKVNTKRFIDFCTKYPRFVRRLQERLKNYGTATKVVGFLQENRDLPSRFEKLTNPQETVPLLEPQAQFPVLPEKFAEVKPYCPNPESRNFEGDDVDVFQIVRAWYIYAQQPLPPPNGNPRIDKLEYDPARYRMPRMAISIFRSYPARAEVYYAEQLQTEGWFGGEGWSIRKFFGTEPDEGNVKTDVLVGAGRYQSRLAWAQGYSEYKEYARQNGLYLEPEEIKDLEHQAALKGAKSPEAEKLQWFRHYKTMTNIDAFLDQSEVEMLPETVKARYDLFRARKGAANIVNPRTLTNYKNALLAWLDILLQHPKFLKAGTIQEDTYELQLKYTRLSHEHHGNWLKPLLIYQARLAPLWPPGLLSGASWRGRPPPPA